MVAVAVAVGGLETPFSLADSGNSVGSDYGDNAVDYDGHIDAVVD